LELDYVAISSSFDRSESEKIFLRRFTLQQDILLLTGTTKVGLNQIILLLRDSTNDYKCEFRKNDVRKRSQEDH